MYDRHKFWGSSQHEGEAFDKWLKGMCVMAKDCEFAEEDNMTGDKIVCGAFDKKVQELMLSNSNLSLKYAHDLCHAAELSLSLYTFVHKKKLGCMKWDLIQVGALKKRKLVWT